MQTSAFSFRSLYHHQQQTMMARNAQPTPSGTVSPVGVDQPHPNLVVDIVQSVSDQQDAFLQTQITETKSLFEAGIAPQTVAQEQAVRAAYDVGEFGPMAAYPDPLNPADPARQSLAPVDTGLGPMMPDPFNPKPM